MARLVAGVGDWTFAMIILLAVLIVIFILYICDFTPILKIVFWVYFLVFIIMVICYIFWPTTSYEAESIKVESNPHFAKELVFGIFMFLGFAASVVLYVLTVLIEKDKATRLTHDSTD